jgi:hypothetical protein
MGGDDTTAIDAAAERARARALRGARRRHARLRGESASRRAAPHVVDRSDRRLAEREAGHRFFSLSVAVAAGPTMGDVEFGFVHDFGTGRSGRRRAARARS